MAFPDGALAFLPVFRQGAARVGEVVLFFGGDHHQEPVGADTLLAQPAGPVHRGFADGDGRQNDVIVVHALAGAALPEAIAAQMLEQLLGIAELGHQVGIAQVGDLDVAAPGENQLLEVENLGPGGDEFLEMLKAVAHGDIADGHLFGHARKNFPVVVLGHGWLLGIHGIVDVFIECPARIICLCRPVFAFRGKRPGLPAGLRWGCRSSKHWIQWPGPC